MLLLVEVRLVAAMGLPVVDVDIVNVKLITSIMGLAVMGVH